MKHSKKVSQTFWLILVIFSLSISLFAEWSSDPEQNNPLVLAENNQTEPCLVSDGAGGAVVAWRDARYEVSIFGGDIFSQVVDANGVAGWTDDGIGIYTGVYGQFRPRIVSTPDNEYILVWNTNFGGFYDYDIYAQKLDQFGDLLWSPGSEVVSNATGTESYLEAMSDGNGGVFVCWQHFQGIMADVNIFAQRLDSTGDILWSGDGLVICDEDDHQQEPQMVSDDNGGMIITWMDGRNSNNSQDIYAQRVDLEGNLVWEYNGIAVCSHSAAQIYPRSARMVLEER